jgi:histidine ammonia-lyase
MGQDVRATTSAAAQLVETLARGDDYVYSVNTGFGALCKTPLLD